MVMRKELVMAAALAALLAAPVLAQNPAPTSPSPTPQAGGAPTPPSPGAQAPAAGAPRFVEAQQDKEMMASDLIGTEVRNAENESLGEINDVLLAEDGRLKAVVVGVGGFLGIAERDVAVPWEGLQVSRDDDQDLTLRLEVSREQLEQAPAFETVAERRAAQAAPPVVPWRQRPYREQHPAHPRGRCPGAVGKPLIDARAGSAPPAPCRPPPRSPRRAVGRR
jgi:sporulation protein YlmC with PRC-barrel domain